MHNTPKSYDLASVYLYIDVLVYGQKWIFVYYLKCCIINWCPQNLFNLPPRFQLKFTHFRNTQFQNWQKNGTWEICIIILSSFLRYGHSKSAFEFVNSSDGFCLLLYPKPCHGFTVLFLPFFCRLFTSFLVNFLRQFMLTYFQRLLYFLTYFVASSWSLLSLIWL